MKYEFSARGHRNITATHMTTLEITKDDYVTSNGDCIIAASADFDARKLKEMLDSEKITVTITAGGIADCVAGTPNPGFSSRHEIVLRKTDYKSGRTLAINCDKAAAGLKKELTDALKKGAGARITIRQEK